LGPDAHGGEREPGEEGAINPLLLQHAGGAAAGAVIGGSTGDDTQSRLRNAAIGAVVGGAAPGVLRMVNGRIVTAAKPPATRIIGVRSTDGRITIPTTGRRTPIPET